MIRNRLLPTHIFAILMMGIAFFLIIMAWALHQQITLHDYDPETVVIRVMNGFAITGTVLVTLCIGLLTFQKWAIWGFLSLFWLAAGSIWVGAAYLLAADVGEDLFVVRGLIGCSVLIYAALFSGILFLNNAQVLKLFHEKHAIRENAQDILDQL